MKHKTLLVTMLGVLLAAGVHARDWVTYEGKAGPGQGKHVVFLTGDEEYRSEEGLPMLAKILSQRHGFNCTVLFPVNNQGEIDPNNQKSLTHPEALDAADAIVMLLRFRNYPDDVMKHFVDAFQRGIPVIALRTSTHAFQFEGQTAYGSYNKFGEEVLGEEWVTHWGRHKQEATRGIIEPSSRNLEILRGVSDVFGDTDVYEAYPPLDATILLRGQVLKGMDPADPPAAYTKKRASDGVEQDVNTPMMPVAWSRIHKHRSGTENRVFCTTMGAATDLESAGLRRLVVNAVYWGLQMPVPAEASVELVGEYKPTMYGFNGFQKGVTPADHELGAKPPGNAGLPLELRQGDRIAILGHGVADRMQHDGWAETYITAGHPELGLVLRNLSAAGDEVATWHRSQNFGSRDKWLSRVKADVIFAFYGFNESFKGTDGLPAFRRELDQFIKRIKDGRYNGRSAPRLVLFSPIANETLDLPNFPDLDVNNTHLQNYTAAMAEVARENGVPFIDLYGPTEAFYQAAKTAGRSLTINGIHLGPEGNRMLAGVIYKALFDKAPPDAGLDLLRDVINEKNAEWHARYRTIDGYNVYGGRSSLAYNSGPGGPQVSNFEVMQQEMAQRDQLTANRDRRVWAVARGGDLTVDDSNLPLVRQIRTNRPGSHPDDSHAFLGGEEAIAKMTVHSGMQVNLFASEEQFPDLINPVQMAWDTRGRLWVSAWRNYPERTPTSEHGDSLLVFEDTDHDGGADKVTPFLDDLNAPTGFQFYKDGVLVMQAPDFWFVRDTDGDGRGDWMERILMGMDSADSHHTANAIAYDPGGAVYLSDGVFHRTQVETAWGPVRNNDAAIYRFKPTIGRFETYVAYGFANPHGKVFDRWGNDIITDATGNNSYFGPAFSGHLDYPNKHGGMRQFWERPSRPCPATGLISSRHFPEEFQGNFLNINVISFQGIYRVKVGEEGSGLAGETLENLISSEDPNFRPIDVKIGPDGAIYFADWHNPIIGHMQHHLRDPNRDHQHGRIYRITYKGRPLLDPPAIHGQPVPALLDLLKSPENGARELAKVELHTHATAQVIPALQNWVANLNKSDPDYEHHLMEALWVHQWHDVIDTRLLERMLSSPEHQARAAATRVLCYWRDKVPNTLALLQARAEDEHPRVRLEAVRAASFFDSAEAANVALAILKRPTDYYLNYTLQETMRQLEPVWRRALEEGAPLAMDNPAGIDWLLDSISTAKLPDLPRTESVLLAILTRPGIADPDRAVALADLAAKKQQDRATLLLDLLKNLPRSKTTEAGNLARQLPWLPAEELKPVRANLAALTQPAQAPDIRQAAWAALCVADGSFDITWKEAAQSPASLTDLLQGIPLLMDPEFRSRAFGKVQPLLTEFPTGWPQGKAASTTMGRYVRIALPRRGTLTLAEVEVVSEGQNVARGGTARQSSTAHGGDPNRAIDGNNNGSYGSGTQTHTSENERNPWWEVDLGKEYPIQAVRIWNRTDDTLGRRLDGYSLAVLDGSRQETFKAADEPAPDRSAEVAVNGDPLGKVRRAAIQAMVSMGAHPEATFASLTRLIAEGDQVTTAARGLRAIDRNIWPKDLAGLAAQAIVTWAQTIPAGQRTSQDFIETLQVGTDLAGMLPADKAAAARKTLRSISVPVFVLRTVREQMRYDIPRIVVEAGKPFEIILINDDFMPHNLVVSQPGSREKIGKAADVMKLDQLDAKGRPFMPPFKEIIDGTPLLEPGMQANLKLTAPEQEGDYDYLCTFPNHWMVMYGSLAVTRDVDAYLAAHPVARQPAAHAGHDHSALE